ncbi:MAG: hypothetical protein DRJ65_02085 [Acidobacteria bacterium]|nr:MAG: hypothetical protein DRJ65_02085 [Acidobacteriota bacterium]
MVDVLGLPDIVAIQEVQDLETLEDLAAEIARESPRFAYEAYLIEGGGYGGIEVGFLVRDTLSVEGQIQIGADVRFDWDGSQLFDRPPLLLEVTDGLTSPLHEAMPTRPRP